MLEKLPGAVGHVLREQRAGLEQIASTLAQPRLGVPPIQISSLAFADHMPIPAEYTADGAGVSPPLQWHGVPPGAASLVLIVEDADAPTPRPLVHAIAVGLDPRDGSLPAGALRPGSADEAGFRLGRNSYLQTAWLPPDPPPGHGVHRYAFQLFALEVDPGLSGKPGRDEVLEALQEHALACGCLIGTYERPDGSVKAGDKRAAVASRPDATA
ncbi:YbhB/YbcL family Raf kinase inhibitor-like protein [Aquabacterium sp. A7-Y]|uniref:YbhB/YbcL family Raf kinase inhibitor-like protein n=1 Tax=Aquabacterium sp. A7-Y TaxID=1349605 RepID=UPI00223E502B|nr:YbhB/YbcL family Raf kinase inhibitor-like protein [Aquabacterium sp. A7-Y]MCW7541730.1 YbhB/YbcL family Raf kinase inhibitor-like protein [Aquabacterium sp. A7-Y]